MSAVTVTMPQEWQGIVVWFGSGNPVIVSDYIDEDALRSAFGTSMQRAVAATRLRCIADMLEEPLMSLRPVSVREARP